MAFDIWHSGSVFQQPADGPPPPRRAASDRRPRALVLTAGLGTRLRPLTYVRAKAAVPVNGEALVRRVIRWLAAQEIRDLVLNLHYLPASIAAEVGDGSDMGVRVRYSWEQPVLGSAGGPRRALPLLVNHEDDSFVLVNGDTLTDIDVDAMLAQHAASRALVTMALIPNPRPDKYGGVQLESGWVTGFTRAGSNAPSFHFIGVQVVQARVFSALADGVPSESVTGIYPRLITNDRCSIAGFVCNAVFEDVGTPADYLATSLALAAAEVDRLTCGRRVRIAESASVVRTALWDDVLVGAGTSLTDCIVCDRVRIPDRAQYERCAIVLAERRAPAAGERLEDGLLIREF